MVVRTDSFNGLALCAGVGGLELGLGLACRYLDIPYRSVGYVEREAFAAATLVARMEDASLDTAPVWDDVTTFDGRPWRGLVDVISGGYPCQPFSAAGKQRGTDDPRHLWPHIARIVESVSPTFCFFENVANHLNLGFEQVAGDLQDLGFRVAAGLFTAAEVGAPHKRERLFILAYSASVAERESQHATRTFTRSESRQDAVWRGDLVFSGDVADTAWIGRGEGWSESARQFGRSDAAERGGAMAGTFSCRCDGRAPGSFGGAERRDALERASAPSLFPPGPDDLDAWRAVLAVRPDLAPAVESPLRRVVDVLASGLVGPRYRAERLSAVGNGVVPLVAAHAFLTLYRSLTESS